VRQSDDVIVEGVLLMNDDRWKTYVINGLNRRKYQNYLDLK
jgi:hypothetical protein